jgi:hypothetical protein
MAATPVAKSPKARARLFLQLGTKRNAMFMNQSLGYFM